MIDLFLIGIGSGDPEHLTFQAARALREADFVLIPHKGPDKADLAELRRAICARFVDDAAARIVEFDLPRRDETIAHYPRRVADWHEKIAAVWSTAIDEGMARRGVQAPKVALLVWGDPSLYDSTLRIAALLTRETRLHVIPGVTSLQMLTAAHAIPLVAVGAPVVITTGRRLRDEGWPAGVDTVAVMLDGDCSFQSLDPHGVTIYWGAFVGMPEQIVMSGRLAEIGPAIVAARASARARHGWIMDIYMLRRAAG